MKTPVPYYQQVLQTELDERISRNPRYSLRSFSKAVRVQPGALSQILAGKRSLSPKLAARFFAVLELTQAQQKQFLRSIAEAKSESGARRISPEFKRMLREKPVVLEQELSGEVFRTIADWYHYAILELTHVPGFRADPKWVASELGIAQSQAKLALERLFRLELLEERDGVVRKAERWIDTADRTVTSGAHRRRQRQVLEKSIQSLENDPIENRNHSAFTVPIDPEKIPEAKRRISAFMQDLSKFLSSGDKDRVYELTVNLFPLQVSKKKNQTSNPGEKP